MKHSRPKTAQSIAVFDISSSSVAGAHAIVHGAEGGIAFLAESRIDAPLQEDLTMDRFVATTIAHLEEVIGQIKKADHHKPLIIQLVLASPWYISQTRAIVYQKETPFTCTQKLIDSLIEKEIEYMVAHDMERFGEFGKSAMIVERQLSQIKLNGYTTNDPFGKKAQMLEVFLTITITPKIIADRFIETIHKGYGVRNVRITTSPYATFIVARDHLSVEDECVVLDIGEEVTDVAFVKGGLFLYQHSFPIGTYELYRLLSDHGNHLPHESKALLEAYRLEKISPVAKRTIDQAITSFAKVWQAEFQKVLDDGHYGFCLPEQCFIIADPRFNTIFTNIISTDPYIQHTCSRGKVRPIFIAPEVVSPHVRSIDTSTPDVPLSIAALFVERTM